MVVSENLLNNFDKHREISMERLEVLKSLGIDMKFAAKCEEMFKQVNATVDEVVAVSDEIKEKSEEVNVQVNHTRQARLSELKIPDNYTNNPYFGEEDQKIS